MGTPNIDDAPAPGPYHRDNPATPHPMAPQHRGGIDRDPDADDTANLERS